MQSSLFSRPLGFRRLSSLLVGAAAVLSGSLALAQAKVVVDPSADAHVISPYVFGLNFPSDQQIDLGKITVGRWGGNSVTRYNYLNDNINTAADYYFENLPGCWGNAGGYCSNPPADPKEASSANQFLQRMKDKGAVALFTIPTIGWVAREEDQPKYNHPFTCGCPATVHPNQASFDPYDTNCGDGINPQTGGYLDCGPPTQSSDPVDPTWVKTWVAYLVGKFGPSNGKRIYALDNEPNLWSSTHHDIRKEKLGYDELWQRMRDYAVAILEADPTAEIAGPAEWGWPNYFCSDKDNISQGCFEGSPDRAAHGGQELVAWLLEQAKKYEQDNGQRILHYLDLHYYPQGGDPPEITRSLWDPTYTDPSWIGDNIRLLPRMRDWVDQHYPGTKLAISEYDFYHHGESVGGVTYAEVLGLFAREGVHVATAWGPPDPGEPAFAAYELYRNYDGAGSGFEKVSVKATSDTASIQSYAAAGETRLTVALVNEGTDQQIEVNVGNFEADPKAALFSNDGGGALSKVGDFDVANGAVTVSLKGQSIGMLVVTGTNPNQLPQGGTGGGGAGGSNGGSNPGGGNAGGTSQGGNGTGANSATGGDVSGGGSGCGCRTAGGDPESETHLLLAAMLGVGLAARRRRARDGVI